MFYKVIVPSIEAYCVVNELLNKSIWFVVMPMPFGETEIRVKDCDGFVLRDSARFASKLAGRE